MPQPGATGWAAPPPVGQSPWPQASSLAPPRPRRNQRGLWLGGWLLALGLFLSDGLGRWGQGLIAKSFQQDLCQRMVQPSVSLSRQQLTQILTVAERSPKAAIRDQAPAPYCTLADLQVRAGVVAQREAYPLAFDPDTWLVLLYEGEEYAGYAFRFQ